MTKPVLLAIGSSEVGGGQKVFLSMVTELVGRGVEVVVALPPGPLVALVLKVTANVHIVQYNLKGIFTIFGIISDYQGKVGLINTYLTKCSLFFAIANLFHRIPLCCTLLNAIIHENLSPLQRLIYPLMYRLIEKLSDGIIVNSFQNRKHFIDRGKLRESSVAVIYSGINLPCLKEVGNGVHPESHGIVIGAVGRLAPEKGHMYLIDALPHLGDLDYECWLIGDGPLRDQLQEQVKQKGLYDKVKFWGFRNDVPQMLQKIDVVVMPSLDETFGLTIVEAFALKKVVIASNVGGIPEVVTDKVTGLLVEPRDSKGIADMIRYCAGTPNATREMAERGYKLAKDKFTTNAMADNTLKYYQNLLDRRV